MVGTVKDYATLTTAIADWTHRTDLTGGSPPYSDYFIQAAQEQFERDILDENFGNCIRYQEVAYAASLITAGVLPLPADWNTPKLFTLAANGGTWPLIFKAAAWLYDTYPIRQATGPPSYIARDVIPAASFTATLNSAGVLAVSAISIGLPQAGMVISGAGGMPAATPGNAMVITGQTTGAVGGTGNYTAQSCSPQAPTYNISSEVMTGGGNVFVFGPYPDSGYQVQGTYYQNAPLLASGGATTNWMVVTAPMTLLAYCMIEAATFLKDTGMMQYWTPKAQAGVKGLVDKDKAERWGNSTLQVEGA